MAQLLIVDNDERIVDLTVWFLRRVGHEVDSALSYAEAREKLALSMPDLMLADLDLGQENGLEELPKLAQEGRLPPTLVVSGFLDATLEASLLEIPGVLATLTKPVDIQALQAQILECLDKARGFEIPRPTASEQELSSLSKEDEEDGWVEIMPLAPHVEPAPPAPAPWNAGEASS